MDRIRILNKALSGRHRWLRVKGVPSIHTFIDNDKYYVNLARINTKNGPALHIDIDNLDEVESDIVNMVVHIGESDYDRLNATLQRELSNSKEIEVPYSITTEVQKPRHKRRKRTLFERLFH
jgi:transposase